MAKNDSYYQEICIWSLNEWMDRMMQWRCCDCTQLFVHQMIAQYPDDHQDRRGKNSNDHFQELLDYLRQDQHCKIKMNLIDQLIDCPWLLIQWSKRLLPHLNTTERLNDAMAILSTLGGAYSALGDQLDHFSLKAQRISLRQLYVAKALGDPTLISKSKLYLALSLMQQRRFTRAERIIRQQYRFATSNPLCSDYKLIDICRACWSKLLYCKGIATHRDSQSNLDDMDTCSS
ncbi:uncharacterized protein TRIADDRAFT_62014 [Trichoplax adhaerens]|uniref:Uncharacterized protein n=1 Tax=Trichoplax adhaerens TaxID=10228 RepID=B3SCL4_TRIAD|nr:hypothetical protein TRIADDRAFT_62014 [Trichoplax adhaerens]EDV19535.1 hypothetical protein TRIADDRAFT_62014 [Trichoplax adhaerens]|eukprot:XP_002117967.1 hypothetical protein TRIADDRAFT_62014 [Trichoplax adhaerens]